MELNEVNIINAVHQFYSTTDSNLRRQLNEWLTAAQESPEAWRFSWTLLRSETTSDDAPVQHFAANCLYLKISKGRMNEYLTYYGNNNNSDAADQYLRDSLIETCAAATSNLVKSKLALALTAYIVYATPDIWPEALAELAQLWRSTQPILLLDILTSIPNETGSMTMSVERKAAVRGAFRVREQFVAETASLLLQEHRTNGVIVDAAVKCVGSWVDFCNDAAEWVGIAGLCLQCAAEVGGSTMSAISKFFCRFIENTELRRLENFIGQLFDFFVPLIIRNQTNEGDEFDDIVDMYVALLENHTSFALKHMNVKDSIRLLMEAALNLVDLPGIYVADETNSGKTFAFWFNLYEDALAEQDSTTRDGCLRNLQPIYLRLSDILLRKLKYPPKAEYDTWSATDKETFERYRSEGGDVFACCYRILTSTNFLDTLLGNKLTAALQTAASSNNTAWEECEVILFALESIGDYVQAYQDSLRSFFEGGLSKIPFDNSVIANTALRMVSKHSHVIADEEKLLKPVLGEFVIKFLNEPTTVYNATVALETLTRSSEAALASDESLCSSICSASFACFHDSRFKRSDQLRALSSIGYVLSTQSNDVVLGHLNDFLAPRLLRLQSVVEGKTAPCTKEELLMEFDVLTALIISLGSRVKDRSNGSVPAVNPVYLIISQSFGLFENLYAASNGDKEVATKIVDTLKRALMNIADDAKDLLPQFCRMLALLFPPHASAVTLTKPLFLLFADDQQLAPTMGALFNSLSEKVIGYEDEDAVEAFLALSHQLVKKQWNFFSSVDYGLNFDCSVRIACRAVGNRASGSPAVRQASHFLCDLFSHDDSSRVAEIVEKYGASLMVACFERLQVELLNNVVEFVADVMFNLMKFNRVTVDQWRRDPNLAGVIGNPLISAMLKEMGNKRKFREYAKQYNLACKKDARNAGF